MEDHQVNDWAFDSGRDHGWDCMDACLRKGTPIPEDPPVKYAYLRQRERWVEGWRHGLSLRERGLGVHGDKL